MSKIVFRVAHELSKIMMVLPTGGDLGAGIWMLGGALIASGGGEIGSMVDC